jgi:hypothetical protein
LPGGPRCRDCGARDWDAKGRCKECRAFPTLGYLVWDLVEDVCVIPDREDAGEPFIPTPEQSAIFLRITIASTRMRCGIRAACGGCRSSIRADRR